MIVSRFLIPDAPDLREAFLTGNARPKRVFEVFQKVKEMKKVLLGVIPAVERIDNEAMEIKQEYLCPANEEEFVNELINFRFQWIIAMGSIITSIMGGTSPINNRTYVFLSSEPKNNWTKNNLVPEFVASVVYEFFQLLLRHPEAHRKAKNKNHLYCSFWPYAVWAYKQLVDENLEKDHHWSVALEKTTKSIWSSYCPRLYKNRNCDISKYLISEEYSRTRQVAFEFINSANNVLSKFRTVALKAMEDTGTPKPNLSVLYYRMEYASGLESRFTEALLLDASVEGEVSENEAILSKSEVMSDMWQVETSLLIPSGIHDDADSLNHLEAVCLGFFK